MKKTLLHTALSLSLAFTLASASAQTRWLPYGPDGGDARSFASDPHDHNHIFMGSLTGTLYDTRDGGVTWNRLARLDRRDDLALDNIIVDPNHPSRVLVAGWVLSHADGGLYISEDGGKTFTSNEQMKGHSIRSFSVAPSDPKIMIIGALDGVFRSTDSGKNWTLISPAGSNELHEVESIAIDPKDPRTIYAGTWHLPWKTVDGGAHWDHMTKGIIDDSDVFSIVVDPTNGQNIYLSACSGIYRSTDQGGQFAKVQGIPNTARRTRVLMLDSKQTNVVFAGTTEGIWRTADSGHTFARNGDTDWIINDVNVDPTNSNRVLLATDRNGILLSNDGGKTFAPSNKGFSARQITAVAQDRKDTQKLYVGVINDKRAGGVFSSTDGGLNWTQQSAGLNGADVFAVGETPGGTLLAGTRHGIYRLKNGAWLQSGLTFPLPEDPSTTSRAATALPRAAAARSRATTNPVATRSTPQRASTAAAVTTAKKSPSVSTAPPRTAASVESNFGIFGFVTTDKAVFAATEEGLLTSTDDGLTWNRIRTAAGRPWRSLSAQGSTVAVASMSEIAVSTDSGASFHTVPMPSGLNNVAALTVDGAGEIWAGGREGVFYSKDSGSTWGTVRDLFVPDVSGLFYDRVGNRVLVTSNPPNTLVFAAHLPDMKISYQESGWPLRGVRPVGDHLVGITPYDGIVLEPRMVVSQETPLRR